MLTPTELEWELRSARRYGSQHAGYYRSRMDAEAEAHRRIADTGGKGRIETVIGRVVYFTEYEDDA